MVPGPLGIPDVATDLGHVYPNLGPTNAAVSGNILSKLHGNLSQDTQRALQDAAARFGVSSGMPGSGLFRNRTARDLGRATEDLQQQGLQNYASILPMISGTQTVRPETQIGVAEQNAVNRSAPNPQQAQSYAQQLFNQYLTALRGPGGGTQGTGGPSGGTVAPPTGAASVAPIRSAVPDANQSYSPYRYANLMEPPLTVPGVQDDWQLAGGNPEDFNALWDASMGVQNPEPAPMIGLNPWDYEYPE
jgi:hypothetical protein